MSIMLKIIYAVRRENVFSALSELNELESVSQLDLANYIDNKKHSLYAFAKKNIPYYISQNSIEIVDKMLIRNNINQLMANNVPVAWRSTSGTTGSPLIFPKDNNASAYSDAMMYLAYSWHGININDKQARIWGRSIELRGRLIQDTKDFLLKRVRLSAFEMNKEACSRYFIKLLKYKPRYFYAYSNALYQFACFVEECGYDGKILGVQVAICTGEVLFPYQREKIADIFDCRVVNEYGSTENGIIGFECEYGKMHLMPTVLVDINNPDENGFGEIVVTELNSRSIPFIKYKNGDVGRIIKNDCECHRPYDLIEIREGRIDAYIRCKNGRLVYDAILAYTLKNHASRFKAYQVKEDLLKIFIIPSSGYNSSSQVDITITLKKYLGDDMQIEIIETTEIPYEKSGKFRYFVPLKIDDENYSAPFIL